MPRETIRRLAEDTERLLVAGAHLAQGNADLARDKDALEKLVTKLGPKAPPVFAKLAEQIGRTLGAKPKEQASELVSLATSIAQVRAGLAQPAAVSDEAVPLAAVPEVETPCNAKDLYALHDALVSTGQGRMEKINEALERGDVADLRLVHAVVQAMSDPYVGQTVTDKVVPRFGRAIVEPVRAKIRFPGTKTDGRRLRALVAVERAGARPLIDRAIGEGSPDVRAAALDAIADHLPGVPELEVIALSILETERSADVRRAAVRALAGYGSDASLTSLFEALDDDRTVGQASEALGRSTHPAVVDRLLERLERAVSAAKAKVKKGDERGEKAREREKALVTWILGALSHHEDPRIPRVARGLLDDDYGAAAAGAVLPHGTPDDVRAIADLLEGDDARLFHAAVAATLRLPPDQSFERLSRLFRAKDHEGKAGKARLAALRHSAFDPTDARWVPVLVDAVKKRPRPDGAVWFLGRTKDPRALAPLLSILEEEKKPDVAVEAIRALGQLGDRRAVASILARMKGGHWNLGWAASSTIVALSDETTVDEVRGVYAALKDPDSSNHWYIRYLLRSLERKYPGR